MTVLSEWRACVRCALRIQCLDYIPPVSADTELPCLLCYDLLKHRKIYDLVDRIRSCWTGDWESVRPRVFEISTPISVETVRQHLVGRTPTVREWLRRDLIDLLFTKSEGQHGLRVQLDLESSLSLSEIEKLCTFTSLQFRKQRIKKRQKKVLLPPQRQAVRDVLRTIPQSTLAERLGPKLEADEPNVQQLIVEADSIFLGGRYLKYQRTISQTPFFDGEGGLRCEHSVSSLVQKEIGSIISFGDFILHGAGREDMDVRMV